MAPLGPLFSRVDLNKLWHGVQNEETLICSKFGKDLFNISKVIGRKKVAQFFLTHSVYVRNGTECCVCQLSEFSTIGLPYLYHILCWRGRKTLFNQSINHYNRLTSRYTAKSPLRHALLPDNYWLQIIKITKHFRCWNVFDDMCRIGHVKLFYRIVWPFWSWFDVNRYTFNENMCEILYVLVFSDLDLWLLDLTFVLLLTLAQRCFH